MRESFERTDFQWVRTKLIDDNRTEHRAIIRTILRYITARTCKMSPKKQSTFESEFPLQPSTLKLPSHAASLALLFNFHDCAQHYPYEKL